MQIAPEHAATASQPWIDDARDSTGIARPPQIQAADQHHDRPRGGKFNQHRTAAPEQQFTMQTENHPGEASIFIDRAEYLQRLRMDVNAMHGYTLPDPHARRGRHRERTSDAEGESVYVGVDL